MDYLESLGKQLSEVTVYDIKSYYNQAKNMVMNFTEMEGKVREATNDDPWGASSTLMNEIAQGTQDFRLFNEIMPTIYKRFTEKEASEWRQIYKALQLLEYLVKHGSERVVDDAKQHLSMIKMLRNFHYIDEKGKDQGINVRNRSKELAELLSDMERVRQERRKARQNKNKYGGIGNDSSSGSSSRYGGFGSESLGYEPSGRSGGSSSFRDTTQRQSFDEYDAGEWDDRTTGSSSPNKTTAAASRTSVSKPVPEPPKPKKEVNLFDFDDEEPVAAPAVAAPAKSAAKASLDDDFDDFQSAADAAAPPSKPLAPTSKPNFFDLMNSGPSASAQPPMFASSTVAPKPMSAFPSMSPPMAANNFSSRPANIIPTSVLSPAASAAAKPASKGAAFDDIWNLAGGSSTKTSTGSAAGGKSLADIAKQKNEQQMWSQSAKAPQSNNFDDFLL